jgi:flavin-dependent dehydrogenase
MRHSDVIIVGGGPAGAAAAGRLCQGGADVLVLDRDTFPRHKLCAGWITPEVVADVQLEAGAYPYGFLSFRRLHFYLKGLRLPVPCLQHSIRRYEFDSWLLAKSGAEVVQHTVKTVRRDGDAFVIDEAFRTRYLIGAGGTSCPVHRALFRDALPRMRAQQTVTLELEFPFDWRDPDCRLWFFEAGLPGYSWYVPKARGWLNVGIGAMAQRLKQRGEDIRQHWTRFAAKLERQFGVVAPRDPTGYSYYVRDSLGASMRTPQGAAMRASDIAPARAVLGGPARDSQGGPARDSLAAPERDPGEGARIGNAFLCGDALGLATRDLCEGIGPAIRSGLRAAESILTDAPYVVAGVTGASLGGGIISRAMDWGFNRGAGAAETPDGGRRAGAR